MWLHVKRKRSYWKWSVCVLISLHLSKNVSIPLGGRTRSSDSTEGLLGHRSAPCCPLPVMKIKCERFIFSFLFFVIVGRGIWNSSVFYFSFQTKTCPFALLDVFKVSRIVLSDLWEGGGGIVASSDIKPGDSLLRVVTEKFRPKGQQTLPASVWQGRCSGAQWKEYISIVSSSQLIPPKLELRYDHFTRCLHSIDRNVFCPVALAFSIMNPAFRGVWMWRIPSSTVAWIMFLFSSSFLIM